MALLESTNVPLGSELPAFRLPDTHGVVHSSDALFGTKGLLVVFTCNHCPYAIAVWPRLIRLGVHASSVGVSVVAINPNINPNFPADAPAEMIKKIREWGIPFPYLYDETQDVSRAFNAQCTPDIFLYDKNKKLVYHGELDDNWKEESKVTKEKLKEAISCLVNGRPITGEQVPTIGCSIKWRE